MNNDGVNPVLIGYILGVIVGLIVGLKVFVSWLKKFIKDTRHAEKEKKRKRIIIVASVGTFIGFLWMVNGLGNIKEPPIALAISILSLGLILFSGGIVTLFYMLFRRGKGG